MNTKILERQNLNVRSKLYLNPIFDRAGLEQLKELAPTDKGDKIKQAFAGMKESRKAFCGKTGFFKVFQQQKTLLTCKRLRWCDLNIEEFLLLKRVIFTKS